jgi:hypothetical protein
LTVFAGDAISSLATLKQSEAPAPHILKVLKAGAPKSAKFFQERGAPNDTGREAQRQLSVVTKQRDWIQRYIARHARLARLFQEVITQDSLAYHLLN